MLNVKLSLVMSSYRLSEVAGSFYPADANEALEQLKEAFSRTLDPEIRNPKILVLPHAGWRFCLPFA